MPAIPAGTYTLRFELADYPRVVVDDAIVPLGGSLVQDAVLGRGEIVESITVVAEPPLLDRRSTNTSVNYDRADLDAMPTSARDFRDITKFVPSITGVELNPVTLSLLTIHFADFSGHIATHPKVTLQHGEGRSFLRGSDRRWVGQVTIQKKHRLKYFSSQSEAEAWLNQALLLIGQGMPLVGTRISLAGYFTSWLERMSPTLRPKTWLQYEQVIRKHILPNLGHHLVQELKVDQIHEFYRLKRQARSGQRTLSLINCPAGRGRVPARPGPR